MKKICLVTLFLLGLSVGPSWGFPAVPDDVSSTRISGHNGNDPLQEAWMWVWAQGGKLYTRVEPITSGYTFWYDVYVIQDDATREVIFYDSAGNYQYGAEVFGPQTFELNINPWSTDTPFDATKGLVVGYRAINGGTYSWNIIPYQFVIANAGPDQIVFSEVTLDGSQSCDEDGSIVSYQWQLTHRTNSNYNKTAIGVAPTVSDLQSGFYDVILIVTDNEDLTGTDKMVLSAIGIKGDFNGDGDVDGSDLQVFSTNYGK